MEKELQEVILKYTLQNAVKYRGKADVSAIIGKIIQENPKLKQKIKEISKKAAEIVKQVNEMPLIEQISELKRIAPHLLEEKKHEKQVAILPELPNVKETKGKIVMRLAPFPSGALHIGNAKTYLLNAFYAEMYKAKLLLVMDDTIGSEEKQVVPEAYQLIEDAFQWLNIKYEKPVIYKSDRLEIYYRYADELIKKGKAYVCFCSVERLRKNREDARECECRGKTVEENLVEWRGMLKGDYKQGQAVLRIKTSMQDKNPAFRDRVLFRISNREHPRIGKKYSVWPMLEFSWAIDDKLLGITHVIRGKDLMMESEMCKFIWSIFRWKHPVLIHVGLVRIEGLETKISKSKAQQEVKKGTFTGWDDPRTWSIQSLSRRGIKAEAIREFIRSMGLNENDIVVPIDILYSLNRKIVESCNRYFFTAEPVKIKVEHAPNAHAELPLHPDHVERGTRHFETKQEFYVSREDYEYMKKNKGLYRFMHLFNFSSEIYFSFHSVKMDESLNAKLIHWLPADKENEKKLVKAEIVMSDASLVRGFAEEGVKNLQPDEVIQFERFTFCRLDRKEKDKVVFWFAHK